MDIKIVDGSEIVITNSVGLKFVIGDLGSDGIVLKHRPISDELRITNLKRIAPREIIGYYREVIVQ